MLSVFAFALDFFEAAALTRALAQDRGSSG